MVNHIDHTVRIPFLFKRVGFVGLKEDASLTQMRFLIDLKYIRVTIGTYSYIHNTSTL